MNNIHDPAAKGNYIAYTSGIIGFQNHGLFSVCYFLTAPDGNELARDLISTEIYGTPHEAEYLATMYLSRVVSSEFPQIRNLWIFSSNQLVVNQLSGTWRIYDQRFQTYAGKIHSNLAQIQWGITWIPRIENQLKNWHWERYEVSHPEEFSTDSALKQIMKSKSARGEN
jgi:hypothetical protein